MNELIFSTIKEQLTDEIAKDKALVELIQDRLNLIHCNECKFYEGVHNAPGHAPCSFWNAGGVLHDGFCSNAERYQKGH